MDELFSFARMGGNGSENPRAETMLCFTDSLKPFVDVPFSNEAMQFFEQNGMKLLQHRSRWGGAVHFALAASADQAEPKKTVSKSDNEVKVDRKIEMETVSKSDSEAEVDRKIKMETEELDRKSGIFHEHIKDKVGGLTNSYIPTASLNAAILKKPSFENAWCVQPVLKYDTMPLCILFFLLSLLLLSIIYFLINTGMQLHFRGRSMGTKPQSMRC